LNPVITEVHHDDKDLSSISDDKELYYFRNSKFAKDMELTVLCMTRDDVQHVKLFKEVAFKPQEFNWNCVQT